MHIDWEIGNTVEAPCSASCPACADTGPKSIRLTIRSAVPPFPELPLAVCGRCGTAFFPTLKQPEYETAHATEAALAFYLEQGAGIDVMAEPLAAIDPAKVRRYLEIGCGFGFSLDFARTVFGWSVQGIDPGFAARSGRDLLGLPISSAYLRTPADAGPEPFDLVLCSEVVEHVFEPLGFLEILRGVLAPGGTLLLTTPNAGAIAPDTPAGVLLPLLSPGYHVTLYSRAGFEALLRRAGFTAVSVSEHGSTLRATAAMVEGTADLSRRLDRSRYIDYLDERAQSVAAETPLGLGFRHRRFKELTHAGRFAEAEDAARPVIEACRARFGIDLDKPEEILGWRDWPADLAGFHARAPFSLCGILYCLGILTWLHKEDREKARAYFQAAGVAGERARAALQEIGSDDGETDDLAWRARGYAVLLGVWSAPDASVEELARLAADSSPLLRERIPSHVLADVRRETFFTLINLAHYAEANHLVPSIEGSLDGLPAGQRATLAFALGTLFLNYRKSLDEAAKWFKRAYEAGQEANQSPVLGEHLPESFLVNARQSCFTTSVGSNRFADADALVAQIEDDLATLPLAQKASSEFAIGIHMLNHRQAAKDAADWFSRAYEDGQEAARSFEPDNRVSQDFLVNVRQAIFTTLVSLGQFTRADSLVRFIEGDFAGFSVDQRASVGFALGIHALTHRRMPKMAAEWFGKVHEASLELLEKSPQARTHLWESLYNQAQALVQAGQKEKAAAALRVLLSPPAEFLPDVPEDLKNKAYSLAQSKKIRL